MEATASANLTNAAIAKYAELVGDHYKIYDENGRADISGFLRKLGGTVEYSFFEESLDVRARGDFTIFIPESTSSRRDRFTMAHELGHYFLHYVYPKVKKPKTFGRGSRNRAETEANVFASSLLMPEERFRRAHRELGGDETKLAERFEVSPVAAAVRAQVLNLT